jgi:GT2 family glycosyltransferase
MSKLSIVILSYNTKNLTLVCLKSIVYRYKAKLQKKEFEIIVVDNNSSDNSAYCIKDYIVSIKYGGIINLIQSEENLGFAKGCNLGARFAKGKYLLFLNSDTQVLDKGFIKMVQFLEENPKVAILGGKLKNIDGSLQPSVGKFYNLFNLFFLLLGKDNRQSPKDIARVDWVSGACLMIRKDIFNRIKGFDGHLFMYMEDMELCYNARKSGFFTYFYPDVSVAHQELGSSNRAFAIKYIYKGILYFYRKHRNYEYGLAKFMLVIKATVAILIGSLSGNSNLKTTYQEALKF